jgi:hypothetical protein
MEFNKKEGDLMDFHRVFDDIRNELIESNDEY